MFENRIDLNELSNAIEQIRLELGQVIVGQEKMLDLLIAALLADGHVLIEGMPGVAKTLTAKLMAQVVSAKFARLQFTPDLMPSDVLGTSVFNQKIGEFEFKRGPIFANIILIDEINRAPAKTQAALFEVMEERQVTLDGTSYKLPPPFIVLATQNPIEQEGTYRLPEAQLDRFLFKIEVNYPSLEEETEIITRIQQQQNFGEIKPILSAEALAAYRQKVREIHAEPELIRYIAQIVHQTRQHQALYLGASPRASIAILQSSKALAAMQGRDFITPEDVREVVPAVLRHRLMLTAEKEMEGVSLRQVIEQLLHTVKVPR